MSTKVLSPSIMAQFCEAVNGFAPAPAIAPGLGGMKQGA